MTTPMEAWRRARPGRTVIGWKLERGERDALLARLPPRYARPIADHVTLRAHVHTGAALPSPAQGRIVGRSDDGEGVEAMVVEVDGTSARPGGGTYHITWSLEAGRKAVESNTVIAQRGWQAIDPPLAVTLLPARF